MGREWVEPRQYEGKRKTMTGTERDRDRRGEGVEKRRKLYSLAYREQIGTEPPWFMPEQES